MYDRPYLGITIEESAKPYYAKASQGKSAESVQSVDCQNDTILVHICPIIDPKWPAVHEKTGNC